MRLKFYFRLFGFPLFNEKTPAQILRLNKSYNCSDVFDMIKKEINNPEGQIDKQGLKLLLRLLEPESTKRISAREALGSEYFQSEENPEQKSQFIHSIERIRSKLGMSFPLQSCKEPTSSGGFAISTGINTCSKTNSQDFFQLQLSPTLQNKPLILKNVSFVDQFSSFQGSPDVPDVEWKDDESVNLNDDIQIDGCNVKAFLDSHCLPISMKNPGKPY